MVEGSEHVLDVDTVIMSIGTSPNPLIKNTTSGLETNKRGCIIAEDDSGLTTKKACTPAATRSQARQPLSFAMGAGKNAAAAIDEYIHRNKKIPHLRDFFLLCIDIF